jgi:hypothetical protein
MVYAVLVRAEKAKDNSWIALLIVLKDFANVANSDAANTLLEHHRGDHAIKIEEGAIVLFSLLYNLSLKELEILRKYIITAKHLC